MKIEIVKHNYSGSVDRSLGSWALSGGDLVIDGKLVARCRATNFAQAGFDIDVETSVFLPDAGGGRRGAARARPSLRGNHLEALASWVGNHPEILRWEEVRDARRWTPEGPRRDRSPRWTAGEALRSRLQTAKNRLRVNPSDRWAVGEISAVRAEIQATKGRLSRPKGAA